MKKPDLLAIGLTITCIGLVMVMIGSIGRLSIVDKPDILIIRETTESHYGEPVLILDYMVAGIATNAIFYHYQMDEYERVMQYLKSIGRLRYATPMLVPLGGE